MVMDFNEPTSNLAWGPQTKSHFALFALPPPFLLFLVFSPPPSFPLSSLSTLLSDSIIDAAFIKDMR